MGGAAFSLDVATASGSESARKLCLTVTRMLTDRVLFTTMAEIPAVTQPTNFLPEKHQNAESTGRWTASFPHPKHVFWFLCLELFDWQAFGDEQISRKA